MRKRLKRFLVLGIILFIISGVVGFKYFDSVKSYMTKYSSYITTTSVVENYKTSEDGTKKAIVSKYIVDGQAYFKISSDYYENPPVMGSLMQVKYNPENPAEAVWDNDKLNIGIVVGIIAVALLGFLSIIKFFVGSKVDNRTFEEKLENLKERRIREEVENYKIVPEKEEEEKTFKKRKKDKKMLAEASNGKLSVYNVDEKNNRMVEDTNANYNSITEENVIKENTNEVIKEEVEQSNDFKEKVATENEIVSEDTILKNKEPEEPNYDIPQDLSGYTKKDDNIELDNQDYVIENNDNETENEVNNTQEGNVQEITKDYSNINSNNKNNIEFDYNNNQTISSIKLTESTEERSNEREEEALEAQEVKVDISDIETKVDLDDLF